MARRIVRRTTQIRSPGAAAGRLLGPIIGGLAAGAGFSAFEGGGSQGGGRLGVGVTDITPGVPGMDLQVVDRRNFLFDTNGRPVKVVSIGAKLKGRGRRRGRGGVSASKIHQMIQESQQNNMILMLAMMGGRR